VRVFINAHATTLDPRRRSDHIQIDELWEDKLSTGANPDPLLVGSPDRECIMLRNLVFSVINHFSDKFGKESVTECLFLPAPHVGLFNLKTARFTEVLTRLCLFYATNLRVYIPTRNGVGIRCIFDNVSLANVPCHMEFLLIRHVCRDYVKRQHGRMSTKKKKDIVGAWTTYLVEDARFFPSQHLQVDEARGYMGRAEFQRHMEQLGIFRQCDGVDFEKGLYSVRRSLDQHAGMSEAEMYGLTEETHPDLRDNFNSPLINLDLHPTRDVRERLLTSGSRIYFVTSNSPPDVNMDYIRREPATQRSSGEDDTDDDDEEEESEWDVGRPTRTGRVLIQQEMWGGKGETVEEIDQENTYFVHFFKQAKSRMMRYKLLVGTKSGDLLKQLRLAHFPHTKMSAQSVVDEPKGGGDELTENTNLHHHDEEEEKEEDVCGVCDDTFFPNSTLRESRPLGIRQIGLVAGLKMCGLADEPVVERLRIVGTLIATTFDIESCSHSVTKNIGDDVKLGTFLYPGDPQNATGNYIEAVQLPFLIGFMSRAPSRSCLHQQWDNCIHPQDRARIPLDTVLEASSSLQGELLASLNEREVCALGRELLKVLFPHGEGTNDDFRWLHQEKYVTFHLSGNEKFTDHPVAGDVTEPSSGGGGTVQEMISRFLTHAMEDCMLLRFVKMILLFPILTKLADVGARVSSRYKGEHGRVHQRVRGLADRTVCLGYNSRGYDLPLSEYENYYKFDCSISTFKHTTVGEYLARHASSAVLRHDTLLQGTIVVSQTLTRRGFYSLNFKGNMREEEDGALILPPPPHQINPVSREEERRPSHRHAGYT
jgi:hypothetical protein